MSRIKIARLVAGAALASISLAGCAGGGGGGAHLAPANFVSPQEGPGEDYVIGPMDELTIFVWRNPELGAKVQVRPDGRITTPLIQDIPAVGKTPSMLSEDIRLQLSQYIQDPLVSVIVNRFAGTFSQQVRVVGGSGTGKTSGKGVKGQKARPGHHGACHGNPARTAAEVDRAPENRRPAAPAGRPRPA